MFIVRLHSNGAPTNKQANQHGRYGPKLKGCKESKLKSTLVDPLTVKGKHCSDDALRAWEWSGLDGQYAG